MLEDSSSNNKESKIEKLKQRVQQAKLGSGETV